MPTLFQRVVRIGLTLAVSAAVGWRAWERWGPVPERPVPPGAEVKQWSVTTCGPAAVAILLNTYGKKWDQATLERECQVTEAGSSLLNLQQALQAHGIRSDGLQALNPEALYRVPRPFIAHLSVGHFVVVEHLQRGEFEVFDPTPGTARWWTAKELYRRGKGWVLAPK